MGSTIDDEVIGTGPCRALVERVGSKRIKIMWHPSDYLTVLPNLRDHRCDVIFAVTTHHRPPNGSGADVMRINFANLKPLIEQVEAGG